MKESAKLELLEKLKATYAEGARMAREEGHPDRARAIEGAWKPVYEYMLWLDGLYDTSTDVVSLMEVVLPSLATIMVDVTKHISVDNGDVPDPEPDSADEAKERIDTMKHMAAQVFKIGALMINAKAGLGKMPDSSQMDTLTVGGN